MPAVKLRIHAPFYSAGLPGWAETALRTAGMRIEKLTAASWLRGTPPLKWPEAVVLYDSQIPGSRESAREMHRYGLTIVNVAPFTSEVFHRASRDSALQTGPNPESALPTSRWYSTFLQELKTCVEERTFFWVRLADCPYPFQELSLRRTAQRSGNNSDDPMPDRRQEEFSHFGQSLVWEPSEEKLTAWLRFRRQVGFHLISEEGLLQLEGRFTGSEFRPAVEIWQQRHFASVPLKPGTLRLEKQSLVFQVSDCRSPVGLFIDPPSTLNTPHVLQPVRSSR